MRKRLPQSFYNLTTMIGMGIAYISLALIAFLYIVELFSATSHPYMGLITFIGLPAVLIFGLLVAFIGILRTRKHLRKGDAGSTLPHIDFNNPRHRRAISLIAYGGIAFMALSAFGSYQAYEYTESVEFCGTVCHAVMKPEYTAYQASPHARVSCVQCHIGSGATWYVKSKLSGAYQVYSSIFNKYSRPIQTPIRNLRPAKETCEQCHWPRQFYSQKLREKTYFAADEGNTRTVVTMLMKIGGGGPEHGSTEGIHAHMYLDNEIAYVALDRQRLVIPYVESRGKDGKVTIFKSTEIQATDAQIRNGERRVVDCIDCHNRPTHIFRHPARSVDQAMSVGWIDPSLPEVKKTSVELLEKPYKTEGEALTGIQRDFLAFYQKTYPKVVQQKSASINAAIKQLQDIFRKNYFPEMKVSWRGFPDNLDHIYSLGCFRCHDDKHVSSDGKVISQNCNSCHTILSQTGPDGKQEASIKGLEFKHPGDVGDMWKGTLCKECHVEQP